MPQANIENKIKQSHKLSDVYNTIKKIYDGRRTVLITMFPPPPTKPITLPRKRGFIGRGKKEEEYAKPPTNK